MNPIFVAIDTPDLHRGAALARDVRGVAGGVKLGLEFFCANGHEGVLRMAERELPIFLDLKLHDIPNTVAKAIEALAALEPAILTVHAAGGREMLAAAKAAAPSCTKVVAVTVLTSLDAADLHDIGLEASPAGQVARLTSLARDSGVDGIVCSGAEIAAAKSAWPDGFFVVPGIRPKPFVPSAVEGRVSTSLDTNGDDQKRVVTAAQALSAGASVLVIGRPITAAPDPAQAIREIAATLEEEARI